VKFEFSSVQMQSEWYITCRITQINKSDADAEIQGM